MKKTGITAERLREVLAFDAETGLFTRRVKTNKRVLVGSVAGSVTSGGYVAIRVDGQRFMAHRLAWLYVHGAWPSDELDHINGVRDDNRLANLRECAPSENRQNQRRAKGENTSGLLGVSWNSRLQKWVAQIAVAGQRKYLGLFASAQEAHQAYLRAKRELHPFGVL